MDIMAGLYAYLNTKTLLTSIIGVDGVYPDEASQATEAPYVTVAFEDSETVRYMQGASALATYFPTFKVHASTSLERTSVTEALRNILHGRINYYLTSGGINVRESWLLGKHDSLDDSGDDSETRNLFCCEMDFKMTVVETVPTLP
jgi:hypothetical protein